MEKSREELIQDVREHIQANGWMVRIGCAIGALIAVGMAVMPTLRPDANFPGAVAYGVGGFLGLASIYFFVDSFRSHQRHPFLWLVREAPERIVWAYQVQIQQHGVHTHTDVVIGTRQGELCSFRFPSGYTNLYWDSMCEYLFPQVTIGHSDANEQRFAEDPSSLQARG